MPAPLNLPGYTYDPNTNRYFRTGARPPTASPSSSSTTRPPVSSDARQRKRARKTIQKGKWTRLEPAQPNLWGLRELGTGSRWESSVGAREKLHHDFRSLSLSRSSSSRSLFPDCLPLDDDITHLSFDQHTPSVLRIGSSNGSIATGNLARAADETAYFPNDEEGWRTSWYLPSRITSIQTCGDRVLATCLGPPAQAVIGTTSDSISLASVTLSPRKTSLWTSALSRNLVALGCDKKVLVTSDPTRPSHQMDGYTTGGNRGDGTVFALDIHENLIFAGTRKGRVQLFDRRSSRSSSSGSAMGITKEELNLTLASPLTHVRLLKEQPHLLCAGLDGFLSLFDLRFPCSPSPPSSSTTSTSSSSASATAAKPTSRPILTLSGHSNSFTHGLGLDVWKDEFVVAAGQDSRLRLWSLRSGRLLSPSSPFPSSSSASSTSSTFSAASPPSHHRPSVLSTLTSLSSYTPSPSTLSSFSSSSPFPEPKQNPFERTWQSPVRAVAFSPLDAGRMGEKAYGKDILDGSANEWEEGEARRRAEEARERTMLRWGLSSLWVAEGGGVEGFVAG
ncbi:hypothetical protein JCM8547_002034 [Rhodosporidiobolus lusitaniae]